MIQGLNYLCCEIAQIVNGKMVGNDEKIEAVTTNSKEISKAPSCFFAIKGKNFNGAEFVNEAIQNGAKLVVTQEKIKCSVTVIYVENVVKALGLLAKKHKGKTKIIAITGSNGKTTTKDMVISVLKTKYSVCGTIANLNNEIGVALTLLSIKNEDFCVVEMGMRGLGEIEWLSYISEPDIGVITNCATAHLEKLGSEKNIFKAKTEILKYVKTYAILPSEKRFKRLGCDNINKMFISKKHTAKNVRKCENSLLFDVGNCKKIKIDSVYMHDINNALIAYTVGKLLQIDEHQIKKGLESYKKDDCRGKILRVDKFLVLNDCYNASYESTRDAILSLKVQFEHKKTAVLLGDMLELGKKSKFFHLKIGKLCKRKKIDKLYVYGQLAKYYMKGFGGGIEFKDLREIPGRLFAELDETYVLLIKASNSMNFKKIIEQMRDSKNDKY